MDKVSNSAKVRELEQQKAAMNANFDAQIAAARLEPEPAIQPIIAPGQQGTQMATSKNNISVYASALKNFIKMAGASDELAELSNTVSQAEKLAQERPDLIPNIEDYLKKSLEALIQIRDKYYPEAPQQEQPMAPAPTQPRPINPEEIQAALNLLRRVVAGENPFAKKEEDKGEDKKEDKPADKEVDKKEDKKEGDKPAFPPKKEEKKEDNPADKKEDKPEPKKEEKAEPKKEEKKSEPKKKGKEEEEKESYEMSKSEEKGAKKAIKIIEDLIKKEKKEGLGEVAPLEEALEELKEFLFEEKKEHEGGLPEMELGKGLPGMEDKPALEKNPHMEDIVKTGPAVPLPPPAPKPMGVEPALGLEKNLHPITDAKPIGPVTKKLPILEKAPQMDMAKEMGTHASKKITSGSEQVEMWFQMLTEKAGAELAGKIMDFALDNPGMYPDTFVFVRKCLEQFPEVKDYYPLVNGLYYHLNKPGASAPIEPKDRSLKDYSVPELYKKLDETNKEIEEIEQTSFKIHARVWTKTAGESFEIDDEPGRIVAIAEGKIIVDWGLDDLTEEKAEDLVVAKPVDNEGTMFETPTPSEEAEVAMGLNAFTPASQEVQKALSSLSFADVMAQHIRESDKGDDEVIHTGTGKVGKVISSGSNGKVVVKFGDTVTEMWPFELQ